MFWLGRVIGGNPTLDQLFTMSHFMEANTENSFPESLMVGQFLFANNSLNNSLKRLILIAKVELYLQKSFYTRLQVFFCSQTDLHPSIS